MPELPEVETTLRGVAPHLVGKTIREIQVRDRRLRWPVPAAIHDAEGCRIESASRRAKYLMFKTRAGTLLLHLGMSGSLRICEPSAPWRKHDHAAILLSSGRQLRFHDPRRFGALLLVADEENHPLIRHLGPEPLGDGFSADHLYRESRSKTVAVKNFIMDSKIVAGVGNIYASEALWHACIRPSRPAGRVTRSQYERLVPAIREVLAASIEMGGTTLRDFVRETGEPGYFKRSLAAYDREGQPCRGCGTKIKRTVIGQRSTFHCPRCQK